MLQVIDALRDLYEATRHAAKWSAAGAHVPALERALGDAFRAQGSAFVRGFARLRSQYAEARIDPGAGGDLDPLFTRSERETLQAFLGPLSAAEAALLATGARHLIGELSLNYSFTLANPQAVAYLKQHGADLVAGVNDTTRGFIRDLVARSVDEGWSYGETARALIAQYDEFAVGRPQAHIDSRAHMIAVTESGQAYEAGNYIPISDAMSAGIKMEKSWDSSYDDHVCDICEANNAEGWIPADQDHASGDPHPLGHPGCRCDEFYQVAD